MNFSNKAAQTNDKKLSPTGKATSLNPNAVEFVPFALRSSTGSTSTASKVLKDASATGILGKTVLDRSESSISNNSDEEAHQYWCQQLPDDITPDFKVMGEDESQGTNSLPFSSLSLHDSNETSKFSSSLGSRFVFNEQKELSINRLNVSNFAEKIRHPVSSYAEDPSSTSFLHPPTMPWDKQIVGSDQLLTNAGEEHLFYGNPRHSLLNDMLTEQALAEMNPLEFLASQFPGFAAESLAGVYFANGGDLNQTIEMITQLELQVDGSLNHNLNSKALSAPNLSTLDFPALSPRDGQNGLPKFSGDDLQCNVSPYQSSDQDCMVLFRSSSTIPSGGASDFASAVRKVSSQDSGIWKYDRNGCADVSVSSSRSSQVLASSFNGGQGRGIYGDRLLQNRGSVRAAPAWLETGEAVANMYSEKREEARDHARLRNAYFEQARQAYLIGNKALAKELSVKGQLHNMQMKAAHVKAQESIYHQRNSINLENQGNGRGQERIIDLHGLHVSEAIHVLKRELIMLRSTARSADHHLQVYICVGTGHHTRGSRTPARLPIAVQRYLLEEEGLDYSEAQPGLLRVVIY